MSLTFNACQFGEKRYEKGGSYFSNKNTFVTKATLSILCKAFMLNEVVFSFTESVLYKVIMTFFPL